jgi:very-short-patch-repair endonuclease
MRDPVLTDRAKSMRKAMSEPETRMWLALRAERFDRIKFRRQKVIGSYIVDFAANAPKLVIEIDGDSHADQEAYDAARTQVLEQQGYTVIRFTNSEVMTNMEGVLERLSEVVARLRVSPPLPTLSPEGERAK